MKTVKWLAIMMLLVVLGACSNGGNPTNPNKPDKPDDKPVDPGTGEAKLTLTVTPEQAIKGTSVTLLATITEGTDKVAKVEFSLKGGAAISSDETASDGYTATSAALEANTTFVAMAKNAEGVLIGSAEKAVTVVEPGNVNAEDKAVTTFAGIPVVFGTAPELSVVDTLVAENGTAAVVAGTEQGGTVETLEDGSIKFTPANGATTGSFQYEVVSGPNRDAGTVTVTVNPLPAETRIVRTLNELTTATSNNTVKTILLGNKIVCDKLVDICVPLKNGQKIMGRGELEGITLSNPGAILEAQVAGDEPADPTQNNITVIELGPETMVEGVEIFGRDIYTAINGKTSSFDTNPDPAVITPSNTSVKNAKITGPTQKAPFNIQLSPEVVGAYYNLTIDGLEMKNINHVTGINGYNNLVITNSTIEMNITTETRGLFIAAEGAATALLDNVDVRSSVGSDTFVPILFSTGSANGVVKITVKNCDVSFPGLDPGLLGPARAFGFKYENYADDTTAGKIEIQTTESIGNSSEGNSAVTYQATSDSTKVYNTPVAKIKGYIQGNKPSVFITR
ncbi:MAG: hypothetical protein ACRCYY_12390 [Trueperaceae bacterium]